MDEIAHFEISPGSIQITPCLECNGDSFTFLAVCLNDDGVSPVGTIARCYNCEEGAS